MIKKKVKPRKRKNKNPSPYRTDKAFESDFKKDKIRYNLGYSIGLLSGIKKEDDYERAYKIQMTVGPAITFYHQGYLEGLKDFEDHLKLIPKNKIKKYTKELSEDIRTLHNKLFDLDSEEQIIDKYKYKYYD